MTIRCDITEEDYLNFNIFHLEHSDYAKKMQIATIIMELIVGIIIITAFISNTYVIFSILIVILLSIKYPIWGISRIKRILEKKINDRIGNESIGMTEITLKERTIEIVSKEDISYDDIERIEYSHGLFLIYIDSEKAIIIPNRAFVNESEKYEFFKIIQEKTGIKAPKVKKPKVQKI